MIKASLLTSKEQVFSNKDPVTGKEYHIAVERLREKYKKKSLSDMPVEKEIALALIEKSGIEQHRVASLVAMTENQFSALIPPILIWFATDDWLLADGNHQYVAAYLRGQQVCKVISLQKREWVHFIVKDYMKVNYKGFSGIKAYTG